jgi:2-iminobutanoate/2-iminopropanoate deaminase
MNRHAVSTDHAPAALGPYSQAIVAGGFVFCSGTAGIDPETGSIPEGIHPRGDRGPNRPGPPKPGRHSQRGGGFND